MNKRPIRLDQYVRELWERRHQEVIEESLENEFSVRQGRGLTSPASELPTEELKLQQMNIMGRNLQHLGQALPERRKWMMLRGFFKKKRNMQVEVYSKDGNTPRRTLGKVTVIGRDFVTLTTLKHRIWLPYAGIESANVPFGVPDVSSTHQHLVIDEELRMKLISRFGETVAKRDVLIQQFFEETLETQLQTWRRTRVEVCAGDRRAVGRIIRSENGELVLRNWREQHVFPLSEITSVRTLRLLQQLFRFRR